MSKTSKELLQEVHSMLAEYFLEELKREEKEQEINELESNLEDVERQITRLERIRERTEEEEQSLFCSLQY